MSTTAERRLPLAEARALADDVVALLAEYCDRIAVAGSIRRGRPDVGDVEVVCLPRITTEPVVVDMFTDSKQEVDLLHERCDCLRDAGLFVDRLDKNGRPAFGRRYKRLTYCGFPLDVFSATPENWGVILLLRTGPAAFNQQLVLKRSQGGWLTRGYFFRDGRLWRLPPPYDAALHEHAVAVPTHEEADVFRALGYRFVPAEQRGELRPPLEEATP